MGLLKEFGKAGIPFRLVPSVVPTARELDALDNADLRDALVRIKEDSRARIHETLLKYKIVPAEIFHEIPELIELKWRETIRVFAPDESVRESSYESLARKLL